MLFLFGYFLFLFNIFWLKTTKNILYWYLISLDSASDELKWIFWFNFGATPCSSESYFQFGGWGIFPQKCLQDCAESGIKYGWSAACKACPVVLWTISSVTDGLVFTLIKTMPQQQKYICSKLRLKKRHCGTKQWNNHNIS